MATHVADWQAFKQMIQCVGPAQLDALFSSLSAERKQLEGQVPSIKRNLQLSRIKMRLSLINMQKRSPKPCDRPGEFGPGAGAAMPGVGTPMGPAMPDRPSRWAPEVAKSGPMLDLYQQAALKSLQREHERVMAETEDLRSMSGFLAAPSLESDPAPMYNVPSGGVSALPTMGSPMMAPTEDAAAAEMASPGIEVDEGEEEIEGPNWLLIGGVALLGLMLLKKTKTRKA
ncbi:MAG: hypothetical protein ACYTAF_16995 [Planctomycetota bacterium]|jgi:hypothetical protein